MGIDGNPRALDDLVSQVQVRYSDVRTYGNRFGGSLSVAERRRNPFVDESVQFMVTHSCEAPGKERIPACETFGVDVMVWSLLARVFFGLWPSTKRAMAPPPGMSLEAVEREFSLLDQPPKWAHFGQGAATGGPA